MHDGERTLQAELTNIDGTGRQGATLYTRIEADGSAWLEGGKCGACGAVFTGARASCGQCGARTGVESVRLPETGKLYNYTVVYRSYPHIKVPFVAAIVDLDGGGTIKGNLIGIDPDPAKIPFGLPVRIVFRGAEDAIGTSGEGFLAHFFVPDNSAGKA
jgi:uncharacterized OB-fold protein